MVTARADLLGDAGNSRRPTFLELFLDLVYVFALTRLSQRLTDDFTLQRQTLLSELGQTFLVTMALWMVWSVNALMTSRFDPRRGAIQFLVVITMFGSMLMAISLPQAFGDLGLIFACTYVALQISRPMLLTLTLRGRWREIGPTRLLCWVLLSGVPWIAGALSGGTGRGILWTAAVALDLLGTLLRWPTPWLGRVRRGEWTIGGEHLAERYQQFVLIAFGEAILVTGFGYSRGPFVPDRTAIALASFLTTVLLWRIYFRQPGDLLAKALNDAPDPARFSQEAGYAHLAMVLGVVATAVGYGLVIDNPAAHTDPAWVAVILGGPALFLAGRARVEYAMFRRIPPAYWAGLPGLVLLIVPMLFAPLLAVPVAGTLVLTGIAVADVLWHPTGPVRPATSST